MNYTKQCYQGSQIQEIKDKFNPIKQMKSSTIHYNNMLKIQDRNLCVARYRWKGLEKYTPITSQQLEGMLYDYGYICAFVEDDIFKLLKFNRTGKLNSYGQLNKIRPIDWQGKTYKERYAITSLDGDIDATEDTALILCDYTPFLSNDNIFARSTINARTTIADQVICYQILINELVFAIKKAMVKVTSEEQVNNMINQVESMLDPANPVFAVATGFDIANKTELVTLNNMMQSEELIRALDFYYKTRRSFNGIPAPDSFDKKERKVTSETAGTMTHTMLVLDNGLEERKIFAKRCKKCYNIDIDVEINPLIKQSIEGDKDNGENEAKRNIPNNATI